MAQGAGDFGSVSVNVRPPNAEIFIDGERWVTPETTGPLVVQLAPGRHTIELRAPGYRPFSSVVDVRRGETTPLNVSLPPGPVSREQLPPPPPPMPPPGRQPGPIQQVSKTSSDDGFVFAPDFKITELNHRTTGFGGFYAGAVFAGQFMIGGGAYLQLDDYNHNSEQMVYGGLVSEWRLFHESPVGLTLHGLAGYGEAQPTQIYGVNNRMPVRGGHGGFYYGYGPYEGFFVAEPEAQVVARFGRSMRLVGGVGYRFTSSDFSNLDGVTGSIAFQFGR